MRVRLLFFAILRDITGKSEAVVDVSERTLPADIWDSLRREHVQLAAYERPPMIAINEEYAEPTAVLHDGDELAFIPPVAGG